MSKLRVAVLFGGQSTEHEVSVMSTRNVVKAIDGGRYETVPILIDRTGHRLMALEGQQCLGKGEAENSNLQQHQFSFENLLIR